MKLFFVETAETPGFDEPLPLGVEHPLDNEPAEEDPNGLWRYGGMRISLFFIFIGKNSVCLE